MTAVGRFRVYFNRHGAAPLTWCVAPDDGGGWEMSVRSVEIVAPARTVYQPKIAPDEDDGRPSAWIAVDGRLTVAASGHATIEAT